MRQVLRKAFSDVVTTELRMAILDGTLAPGSRIRQEELASRLGVSRAPIREALVVLEREGLIQTERWRGAVVSALDAGFLANVYDLRTAIDAHVASTLAARPDFDASALVSIVTDGRGAVDANDLLRLIDLDSRFHMSLYEADGNPVLVDVMRAQWSHLRRAMAFTLSIRGYARQVWDEHAAIVDAIVRQQVNRARRLAEAHTANAGARLITDLNQSRSTQIVGRADGATLRANVKAVPFDPRRHKTARKEPRASAENGSKGSRALDKRSRT